jgi:hypothetical protein
VDARPGVPSGPDGAPAVVRDVARDLAADLLRVARHLRRKSIATVLD